MAEKISVQIALEGGAEVKKQLADIGKAGDEAFADIGKAGATAADGIAQAGESSATAATEIGKVNTEAKQASESMKGLSLETVKTSAEIAKVGLQITKLGVEIGLAVARHNTLAQSLFQLATGASTAVKAIGLLAPELTAVAAAAAPVVLAVTGAVVAFEAIEKVAIKVASSTEKLNHSLQMLAENAGQSFKSLQEGKAALEQLGIGGDRFEGIVIKINEAMSSLDIGAKFREGADAIEKAAAFSPEHFKALANNMGAVLPLVKKIGEGAKGITFDGLTTAATKIDAVTASMKQAVDAGKNAGQVLLQFIVNADKLSAIQVGKAFGITEEDVDRIRRLAANGVTVEEIFKRIQGTGVLISPESSAALDRMREKTQAVDAAWVRLKQSMGSAFLATEASKFVGDLETMKAAVLNFAAATVEAFTQAGAGMAQGFQGGIQTTMQELAAIAAFARDALGKIGISSPGLDAFVQKLQTLSQSLQQTGQAGAQAGQQAAAGLQLVANPLTGMPELINATNAALAQTGQAGAQAGAQAAQGAQQGTTAWQTFLGVLESALALLKQGLAISPPRAPAIPGKASGGLLGGRGTGTSDSNLAWLSRGEYIMPAHAVRQPGVLSFLEALRRSGGIPGFAAGGPVRNLPQGALTSSLQNVWSILKQMEDQIKSTLDNVHAQLDRAARQLSASGLARGGLLGGRGTGTSDSNLAWVSRGEHIMPARAVAQPGVLAFLEALRRSGGNLSRVLDGMGRFALGGMVPRAIPAFAAGGLAGGMSNVTIQFPGLPAISGLRASSDVVDQLHKAAALAQVRSGGRKPSRYS